jgi:hypothetical protein
LGNIFEEADIIQQPLYGGKDIFLLSPPLVTGYHPGYSAGAEEWFSAEK